MDFISYLNFPALIIDNHGVILTCSKPIQQQYKMKNGDDLFSYCYDKSNFSSFVLNLANLPLGATDKCLSTFHFSDKNIEVYVSVIDKNPARILIEFHTELASSQHDKLSIYDLVDNSNNLLSLVSKDYRYLSVNEQYTHKWGIDKENILNKHVSDILGKDAFNKIVKKELDQCFAGKMRTYADWFFSEKNNQMHFLKVAYRPVFEKDSKKVKSVAVTVTDITDIQTANDVLSEKAFHDPLTNLDNRYSLHSYFDKLVTTLNRKDSYTLVFIDLDKFKETNDLFGHNNGDDILKEFATNLKDTLRKDDFCCRWGGDEFILILSNENASTSQVEIRKNIEQRLKDLQLKTYMIGENKIQSTFSFGLSFFPNQSTSLNELISIADAALYSEKSINP